MNSIDITEICGLLYELGITSNYTGYFHTSHAISLSVQEPERLQLVTKWIYPDVAKRYHTNWRCVERNIRTVARIAWENNRPALEQMARHELPNRPTSGAFLAILTNHARMKSYDKVALPEA